MKRLFQTKKYKNYSRKVARKALKKRQRRISFLKKKNRSFEHKNSKERSDIKKYASYEHVPAPNPLSFTKNTELVIAFLNKLEELLLRRRKVFVELKHVSSVDYGAIAVLLSVMIKFQANRVKFDGDFPHDSGVKKQFIESGFFDHLGKE